MTKKARNTRLEKLVKQNAERRADGRVFRVETLFSVADKRQADLAEFLGELPRGGASDFVRRAVWEKKTRAELGFSDDPWEQFNALISEQDNRHQAMIDYQQQGYDSLRAEMRSEMAAMHDENEALRAVVNQLIVTVENLAHMVQELRANPPRVTVETATRVTIEPDDPAVVQSSGLDLSRPRPKKALPAPVQPDPVQETLSEAESIRLAKLMAESVKAANPGGKKGDR